MPLSPHARLGPYEIVDLIGRGGMGEVYRAVDMRLGRAVAVKVLPAELAEHAESLERFRREARAIAALSHPNIVAIFDVDVDAGAAMPYVVTELLEGETLRERLKRGPMALGEMLRVATAVAEGLAAAHAKGIIHRDLKPENIFLTAGGGVKILDFGLASTILSGDPALTQPGMVIGTIGYMSPEQLRGAPLTTAADVFPLGCLAYEMLEGEMPFQRDSHMEVIASVLRDEPFRHQPPHAIPDALRDLIERCLEKSPARRIQNAAQVVAELRAIDAGEAITVTRPLSGPQPRRRRPWWIWTVVLAAIVLGGIAAVLAARNREMVDDGYTLRMGDITGNAEARRLLALCLHSDGEGNRSEAIELCSQAARLDPRAPLPAAFLSSFVYYNGDPDGGRRWAEETRKRLPNARSTYEAMLCRYLTPESDSATSMTLSSSLLALRPDAWRLRLGLAHRHLDRREMPAMLAQLQKIDVTKPDDRRLAVVLADRASLGDVAGAMRELQRSRLITRPPLLGYTGGRIAWSRGQFAQSAALFDQASERATVANQISIAIDARVLGAMARIGAGDLPGAQSALDLAAAKARQAALPSSEVEAQGFGAYVAQCLGDREGMERRLRAAAAVVPPGTTAWASLRLFAVRARAGDLVPSSPLRPGGDNQAGLAGLLAAREAWARGDGAAARLLRQSRSEGIDATWFAEEAALLDRDLGAPAKKFAPDPPYPNRLRLIAVWELARP